MWGDRWCGDVLLERRLSARVVVLWNLLVEEGALAAIIGRLRLMEDFFNGKRSAWRDLVTGYCSE